MRNDKNIINYLHEFKRYLSKYKKKYSMIDGFINDIDQCIYLLEFQ
jgi:hypothetical protein